MVGDVLDNSCKLRVSGSVPFHHVPVSCSMASLFKQILPKIGKVNTWDRLKSIYFFFYTDFHCSELHHMFHQTPKVAEKSALIQKRVHDYYLFQAVCFGSIFFFLNILSPDIEREKRKGGRNEGRKRGKGRRKRGKEGIKDSFTNLIQIFLETFIMYFYY